MDISSVTKTNSGYTFVIPVIVKDVDGNDIVMGQELTRDRASIQIDFDANTNRVADFQRAADDLSQMLDMIDQFESGTDETLKVPLSDKFTSGLNKMSV